MDAVLRWLASGRTPPRPRREIPAARWKRGGHGAALLDRRRGGG